MNARPRADGTLYVVDRKEGRILVVVSDDGHSFDVEASLLPKECRASGAVLRIPPDTKGGPDWRFAVRDRDEETRRINDAAERLKRLKGSDPGGDVTL